MEDVGEIRSCRIFSEIKREAQFIAKRDTVFFSGTCGNNVA